MCLYRGLKLGTSNLVTAYLAEAGTLKARKRVRLHLALGVVVGPTIAEAEVVISTFPVSSSRWRGIRLRRWYRSTRLISPIGTGSSAPCVAAMCIDRHPGA